MCILKSIAEPVITKRQIVRDKMHSPALQHLSPSLMPRFAVVASCGFAEGESGSRSLKSSDVEIRYFPQGAQQLQCRANHIAMIAAWLLLNLASTRLPREIGPISLGRVQT